MNREEISVDAIKGLFSIKTQNPFVGLRPFEVEDCHLFFGRDKQIAELLQKLHATRFLAVVGSSGCGKSSLIRAGVIPKLKAGFFPGRYDDWAVATVRPGGKPLQELIAGLNRAINKTLPGITGKNEFISEKELKESGALGLIEKLNDCLKAGSANLLLFVDQFEELFTHKPKNEEQKNDYILFVSLLLKLSREQSLPVYVVTTMRSEYIGSCNKYFGLPEVLNESQYLVPRLGWTQVCESIEKPIRLYGQQINRRLVETLANDSDKDTDQLPVLQHCLMRIYQCWLDKKEERPIDFSDYEEAGKLDSALLRHAREIYGTLKPHQQQVCKYLFQALTDLNLEDEPVRRPQPFQDLVKVCEAIEGTNANDVLDVVHTFRQPSVAFLTPFTGEIEAVTRIDISHESLMRNWHELTEWIQHEYETGKLYKKLNERRQEGGQLIEGPVLQALIDWRDNAPHNAAWASRYHLFLDATPDAPIQKELYEANLTFLQESQHAVELSKKAEEKRIADEALRQKEEELRLQKVKDDAAREFQKALQLQALELKAQMEKEEALRIQKLQLEAQRDKEEELRLQKIQFVAQRQKEEELLIQQTTYEAKIREREQKSKQRKTLLYVFVAGFFVAIGLASFAFSQKFIADRSKAAALQQKANADSANANATREKLKAIALADELEEQKGQADRQRDTAVRNAEAIKDLLTQMQLATASERRAIEQRNKVLEESERRVAMAYLTKSSLFNTANFLTNDKKEEIAKSLIKGEWKEPERVDYSKYIKLDLWDNIDAAVEAREEVAYSATRGLRLANSVWKDNQGASEWVDSIIAGIFERNNFPVQKIEPLLYQSNIGSRPPVLLSSAKDGRFAAGNQSQVITGIHSNGKITISKVLKTDATDTNLVFSGLDRTSSNALVLTNDERIFMLKDDSVVLQRNGDKFERLGILKGSINPKISRFSPDGKWLITLTDNAALLRWRISDFANSRDISPDTLIADPKYTLLKQIVFAPSGRTIAISFADDSEDLFSGNSIVVWDIHDKKPVTKFGRSLFGEVAGFATDSNYLIVGASGRYADLYDTTGRRISSLYMSFPPEDIPSRDLLAGTILPVRQISLSSDWRSLLVDRDGTLYLFTAATGDSVFKAAQRVSRNIKVKKLFSNKEKNRDALFLDTASVISLSNYGTLYSWKTTTSYTSLQEAFYNTRTFTDSTYAEKDRRDTLAIEKLLQNGDASSLREAGTYYFKQVLNDNYYTRAEYERYMNNARRVFSQLLKTDASFFKQIDSGKLNSLEAYSVKNFTRNSAFETFDTLTYIDNLRKYISEAEEYLKQKPDDVTTKKQMASDYWNLSWYLLFAKQYDSAIVAAKKCLETDSLKNGVNTNLALGYLLKGEFANAEKIYRDYNGKTYLDGTGRKFTEVFQQDFNALIKAGIISKSNPEIYNKMQEIKSKILRVK